jgi:hypothetical protein
MAQPMTSLDMKYNIIRYLRAIFMLATKMLCNILITRAGFEGSWAGVVVVWPKLAINPVRLFTAPCRLTPNRQNAHARHIKPVLP